MNDVVTGSWSGGGGKWSILVHGGAGDVPPDRRASHAEGCALAAEAGAGVLVNGGSALDAVQRAVEVMEDDSRFNAGTGASLDEDGVLALDAAIMDGASLAAGAVAVLSPFRHPILIAREILRDGRHILMAGKGASDFAEARGYLPADPESMITTAAKERLSLTRRGGSGNWAGGTVGAVAYDAKGHVAAATSTGGFVGKRRGRVGDSPILGAGTYADDASGAFSGTGEGEAYLRTCLAARTCFWMEDGMSADEAAQRAIRHLAARANGSGGVILADRKGRLAFARSTATMSWAARWDAQDQPLAGCLAALRSSAF